MKIIGIMGNGGSGKTTFSNTLEENSSVGVIHVDDLVGEVKRKYFKFFLQPKENNSTESTSRNPKLKTSSKAIFYKNKLAFTFLMKLRSILVSSEIQKEIDNFKKEGKQLVVVDDWVLSTHKKLINQLSHIYILNRKYQARRTGLRERDNLSTEELKIAGLPYALGFVKMPVGENVTYIDNNGTILELQEKAHSIYSRYVEPSFDDRYKLRDSEFIIANVPHIMSNLKTYSDSTISRDSNN